MAELTKPGIDQEIGESEVQLKDEVSTKSVQEPLPEINSDVNAKPSTSPATDTEDLLKTTRKLTKRKRVEEENTTLEDVISIFLRIIYPLSKCMRKHVVVGVHKEMDCKPVVMITQNDKTILVNETAWKCLYQRMQLVDCYLLNHVFGKRTTFGLLESNIEVENIMLRGEQLVRIKDATKYDLKIQLNYEEFSMLYSSASAINWYINQLNMLGSHIKDYLVSTMETHPNAQLIFNPTDSSIINRLPQEVLLYRRMRLFKRNQAIAELSDIIEEATQDQ